MVGKAHVGALRMVLGKAKPTLEKGQTFLRITVGFSHSQKVKKGKERVILLGKGKAMGKGGDVARIAGAPTLGGW
jgi:hypothetical protein